MIDDSLWDLKQPKKEHPGIILSHDLHGFPIVTAFCSSTEIGEDADECLCKAPVPPFQPGTRIYFRKTRSFSPAIFSGTNAKVRWWGQVSAQDLIAVREAFAGFYKAGLLVGVSRL